MKSVRQVDAAPGGAQPVLQYARQLPSACVGSGVLTNPYPLDAPGIPVFGQAYLDYLKLFGDDTEIKGKTKKGPQRRRYLKIGAVLRRRVQEMLLAQTPIRIADSHGKPQDVLTLPGHLWLRSAPWGPQHASVMVVGKFPGHEELLQGRNFRGRSGQLFLDICHGLKIPGLASWYITNLLKVGHPDGIQGGPILGPWVEMFLPVLHLEIRLVRPRYLLCLGAEVAKALLGRDFRSAGAAGASELVRFPVHASASQVGRYHPVLVYCMSHPAQIFHHPKMRPDFEAGMARFRDLLRDTRRLVDAGKEETFHRVLTNEQEVRDWLAEVKDYSCFSIDAEWEGQTPWRAEHYLRTIQVSWREKHAVVIRLRGPGGYEAFQPSEQRAIALLRDFFQDTRRKVGGQFFLNDLMHLRALGLDLVPNYEAPQDDDQDPGWVKLRDGQGGFDTGLMAHNVHETSSLDLEDMGVRHAHAPRFSKPLQEWKQKYCSKHKIKEKTLPGYGNVPTELLEAYAGLDPDITLRIKGPLEKLLDEDEFGNCSWESYWADHRGSLAALEMMETGLLVDRQRLDYLVGVFDKKWRQLRDELRVLVNWNRDTTGMTKKDAAQAVFNPNSRNHVTEVLYGEALSDRSKYHRRVIRTRPEESLSLYLPPLLTTGKRPRLWEEVVLRGEDDTAKPRADGSVLSMYFHQTDLPPETKKIIRTLLDYSYIAQVRKNFLRPPPKDADGHDRTDERGYYQYAPCLGLGGFLDQDDRIRTQIFQTAETGRWKSSRPNLMNQAKTREEDYRRVLGEAYPFGIRGIFTASPDHVLLCADYSGAELMAAAILSGDANLLAHCQDSRYDIHSTITVSAFQLDCAPSKDGLESIKKEFLRDITKRIIFGTLYGRGAKAVAIEIREQGINISTEAAEQVQITFFRQYPGLAAFFSECRGRVIRPRWICGAFGRYRRFPLSLDQYTVGDMEREAMNFLMQNAVAELATRALDNFGVYRDQIAKIPEMYRRVLMVHDEIVLEVHKDYLDFVVGPKDNPEAPSVLRYCMRDQLPVYRTDLDGNVINSTPYYFNYSYNVYRFWGQKLTAKDCDYLGVSHKYIPPEKPKKGEQPPAVVV